MTRLAELKQQLQAEQDKNFTLSLSFAYESGAVYTHADTHGAKYRWVAFGLTRADGGHVIGVFIAPGQLSTVVYAGLLDKLATTQMAQETGHAHAVTKFHVARFRELEKSFPAVYGPLAARAAENVETLADTDLQQSTLTKGRVH